MRIVTSGKMAQMNSSGIFFTISLIVLIFTNTNYVYISAAFVLIAPAFIFTPIFEEPTVRQFQVWTVLLCAYAALSTLLYNPSDLIDFDFYRRDGNMFISLAPLLCSGFFLRSGSALPAVRFFVLLSSALIFIVYAYFLISGSNVFKADSGTVSLGVDPGFSYLFLANNAAGGFISEVSVLALIFAKEFVHSEEVD